MARRWLRRFGPATTADLQWWMGWTLGLTRRALAGCAAVQVELDAGRGWLAADDDPTPEAEPWVGVLPGLDPSTMGWKQRDWYLPDAAAEVFDSTGNGGPTLWVDGRIVGAWAQTRGGEVATHYFEQVPQLDAASWTIGSGISERRSVMSGSPCASRAGSTQTLGPRRSAKRS